MLGLQYLVEVSSFVIRPKTNILIISCYYGIYMLLIQPILLCYEGSLLHEDMLHIR